MPTEGQNQSREPNTAKPLFWIASSLKDLRSFPDDVKEVMGFALYQAQLGGKHPAAKPLKGFGGAGVLEIVEDFRTDTYRGVYTVKYKGVVYVLDAFQKKSKKGAETPQQDIERIVSRLKAAEEHYQQWSEAQQEKEHAQEQEPKKSKRNNKE